MLKQSCRNFCLAFSLLFSVFSSTFLYAAEDTRQTLRIAIKQETGDLDLLQNVSALSAYSLVFDPLIRYGENGQLEPALATSWKVSDNGLKLQFKLRENVTFSDGTPFDANVASTSLQIDCRVLVAYASHARWLES